MRAPVGRVHVDAELPLVHRVAQRALDALPAGAAPAEPDESAVALIIEAEGRAVGDINLFEIDVRNRRASIGLSIWRQEDRGRGYGTDAMRALLGWAFREYNLHRVELSVDPSNTAAIRVYEKLGFAHEGRRREAHYTGGTFVDDVMMGLLRGDFLE